MDKSSTYEISCKGGAQIKWEDFKEHYICCDLLSKDFKPINTQISDYIKNGMNLQSLRNLIEYFRWSISYVEKVIEKCEKREKQMCSEGQEEIGHQTVKLLPGGHMIHNRGLRNKARAELKNEKVQCSKGKEEIPITYLNQAIDVSEMNQISDEINLASFSNGLVTGVGGDIGIELEEGQPNFKEKDEKGKLLSKEAANHKAKYRCKGPKCSTEMGVKCRQTPYHTGFTGGQYKKSKGEVCCKFCKDPLPKNPSEKHYSGMKCGNKEECKVLFEDSCQVTLECGHPGLGSVNSKTHMPCLHPECVNENPSATFGTKGNDFCSLCYGDTLEDKPCVQLKGKHVFHAEGILNRLKCKWDSLYVDFSYLICFVCKEQILGDHSVIKGIVNEDEKLKEIVSEMALDTAEKEQIPKSEYSSEPYNENLKQWALDKIAIYKGHTCKDFYPGGRREGGEERKITKEDLKCQKGINYDGCKIKGYDVLINCNLHGTVDMTYKCRFCCSIATFFCWGDTHFCASCHEKQENEEYMEDKKPQELPQGTGKHDGPLKILHPLNGTGDYAIRCNICV